MTTARDDGRERGALLAWYRAQKRDLPWRRDRDPYRIWISEVMLQQTTVAAVIPYYLRFLARFPALGDLAAAPLEDVLAHWAGLGYYSRARNLHASAQALVRRPDGFPRTYQELIEMPGFGPYTARAVASLAFGQPVGVLDGNVIRTLTRRYGLALEWWRPAERTRLQDLADRLAAPPALDGDDAYDWNQGMMELGATVCTPTRPACLLCPWSAGCVARTEGRIGELPLKRARRSREIWAWHPTVHERGGRVAIVPNDYAPFLKGHWIWPGRVERLEAAPKSFDYRATVTHRDVFVALDPKPVDADSLGPEAKWISRQDLSKWVPASLALKAIEAADRRAGKTNEV